MNIAKYIPQGIEVRQLGYVKEAKAMAKVYSAANLYCVTPLAATFSTTVLESMVCGTPVVGFAVGGIPEQVMADCGRLVPSGDAKALRQAITELLNDDAKREQMARNCRKRAEEEYSLQRFMKRHFALYEELTKTVKKIILMERIILPQVLFVGPPG